MNLIHCFQTLLQKLMLRRVTDHRLIVCLRTLISIGPIHFGLDHVIRIDERVVEPLVLHEINLRRIVRRILRIALIIPGIKLSSIMAARSAHRTSICI